MKKNKKTLLACKTDAERAAFFAENSSLDMLEQGLLEELPAVQYKKRLKKDTQLNIRIDAETLDQLKLIALKQKIGYHTLARMYLQEKIQDAMKKAL